MVACDLGAVGHILVETPAPGVALVRICRPEARNALSMPLREELADVFHALEADHAVRAVVLAGTDGFFAAGADVRSMVGVGPIEMYQRHTERLWGAVGSFSRPVIAAVNGHALGGGLELAMNTDIIIAADSAKLGQPEVRLGIMPGAGGTQRLLRAVGKFHAMRLCLTGEIITATEARDMGLVSMVVPSADVEETAIRMAQDIAALPAVAVEQIKEVITLGADAPLEAAMALERKALQLLFASADKEEGLVAFTEKRRPNFTGR
ncbi:enoyl-CoA hydratase-related protein [Arthrobacter koreensis]|uniref:Enoyl-CoA hydratase-related protein n=1 Tax=Arthrobacter koreensis TaxID=199136 RepID=A0ABY6FQY5_9MICC|nr:enoyl-CoA hydratase-related protein [Arthrobacter koreensis]UYB35616.1 enoyl-CoA hydratase-related protein [Arthrobacter koreensis]